MDQQREFGLVYEQTTEQNRTTRLVSITITEFGINKTRGTVVFYCAMTALQRAEMNCSVLQCDGGIKVSRDERRVLGFGRETAFCVFQKNERGREDIEILVFEENVQNNLVFF